MKKILLASAFLTATAFMFSSCLKDKGFENNQYGINDPDTQPPGVGFPESSKSNNGFAVNSVATPQTIFAPFININSGKPASSDVHVTLTLDPTIVTAYNTANGTALTVPTAGQYTIASLSFTIPAGQTHVIVPIVIPNASLLSLTTTYALGFKIASVDGGYLIASNQQKVLISWSVKNQYDGIYNMKGFVLRAGDASLSGVTGPAERSLVTTGAYSVRMAENHGWSQASGPAGIAATVSNPTYTVNPANNTVLISSDGGTFPAGMQNEPGYPSRWDPATKTFYVSSVWSDFVSRRMTDTLTYLRPRP